MKKAWQMVKFVSGIVAWALIVVCGSFLALVGIGPHFADYHTLSVLSGSMRPGIPVGGIVVVRPESPRSLRAGQIITYQVPVGDHRVISHRVVKVVTGAGTEHPVFQTKGDANNGIDPWLARVSSRTVWQVRYSVPAVGRMVSWLRHPGVHTGTVRVVPAVLAVLWLIGIWRREPGEPGPNDPSGTNSPRRAGVSA